MINPEKKDLLINRIALAPLKNTIIGGSSETKS